MAFLLTSEQRDLADGVDSLLADRATGIQVREVIAGKVSWHGLWDEVSQLGLSALAVPEEDDGLGQGMVELAAVCETCGRHLAPGPFVATAGWFVPVVVAAGGDAAAASLGPVLGGAAATLGFADRLTGSGTIRLDGHRLTVTDLLVADAERVDFIGFLVAGEEGVRLAVAPAASLEIEPVDGLDPSRPLGRVDGDGVTAAVSPLPAPTSPPPSALVAAGAELVGIAARMLELAAAYAGEREQFGTKIGSFQGVKHRLVDAHLLVERARSLIFRAAVVLDEGGTVATARAARLGFGAACEAATQTARSAVQVHGGVGLTAEHDISLFYLRARQASMQLGGRDASYLAAARSSLRDGGTA